MRVLITKGWAALLVVLGLAGAAQAVVPRFEAIGEPGAVRDNVVSALLSMVVQWFITILGLSVLTTLYGHLVERRPLVA